MLMGWDGGIALVIHRLWPLESCPRHCYAVALDKLTVGVVESNTNLPVGL